MIIIDPEKLGWLWTWRLAFVAVMHLRRRGYQAYVGSGGAMDHGDIPADDWNDAVAASER